MQDNLTIVIGFGFIVMGVLLIQLRALIVPKVAELYRKMGIDVSQDVYAKQFVFVGIMLMLLGLFVVTGLFHSL